MRPSTCTAPASTYTAPITVNARISPTAPAQLTNTATVSTSGDTNTTNNSGSTTITVTSVADPTRRAFVAAWAPHALNNLTVFALLALA